MAELAVGATIWRFDPNRRVYAKDRRGAPIYREYWVPVNVVGETSRSWLAGYSPSPKMHWKIPKKGPHRGWAFTKQEIDDACWIHDYAYEIGQTVGRCDNAAVLRQVAALIGWAPGDAK